MKNKSFAFGILFVAALMAVFIYLKSQSNSPAIQTNTNPSAQTQFSVVPVDAKLLIKPHSPTKGSETAPVTMVEFLDPECESCAATYPMVKKILQSYGSQIKIVARYMTYHQNSKYVANILEGARAENKYWETLELLFETQSQWANHHNPQPELIPEILEPLKLNIKKIIADAKAGKYNAQIEEDMADGKTVGVAGTPTFFVNGQMVQELSYEALNSEILKYISKH